MRLSREVRRRRRRRRRFTLLRRTRSLVRTGRDRLGGREQQSGATSSQHLQSGAVSQTKSFPIGSWQICRHAAKDPPRYAGMHPLPYTHTCWHAVKILSNNSNSDPTCSQNSPDSFKCKTDHQNSPQLCRYTTRYETTILVYNSLAGMQPGI